MAYTKQMTTEPNDSPQLDRLDLKNSKEQEGKVFYSFPREKNKWIDSISEIIYHSLCLNVRF